jgi:hypothetical protein
MLEDLLLSKNRKLAYDLAICLYFVEGNHDEELWKHELA